MDRKGFTRRAEMESIDKYHERLRGLAVSDNGFLFDTWTGNTYGLNETGVAMIRVLQKALTGEEMVKSICEEFEADEATAKNDLEEFVTRLCDFGILPKEVRLA
jgi:hypothetical protein